MAWKCDYQFLTERRAGRKVWQGDGPNQRTDHSGQLVKLVGRQGAQGSVSRKRPVFWKDLLLNNALLWKTRRRDCMRL